jgi:zinc D-Ala-D-Ala carboxypeptidase
MKLSEHFTLEELMRSDMAVRMGIDNTPSPSQVAKLQWLAGRLEQVRAVTGPLRVTSGYRCIALNRAIGSRDTSQHVKCEAADLQSVIGVHPLELCQRVADSGVQFDQLIYEFGAWMHVSFVGFNAEPVRPRRQELTINRDGTFAGLVTGTKAVA